PSADALLGQGMLASASLCLCLAREDIAAHWAEAEGQPDNAGAAVFGGAVLSVKSGSGRKADAYSFSPLHVRPEIALVFAVPELEIETSIARAVLPASLPYATAVAAIAKAAALVQGLSTGNATMLAYALDD